VEYLLLEVRFFVYKDEVEWIEAVGKYNALPKQVACFTFYGNMLPLEALDFWIWERCS
jgi:hypothetical protein